MNDFDWAAFWSNEWTITVGGGFVLLVLWAIASAIWKSIPRRTLAFFRWLFALRVTTARRRESLREEGRQEVRAEHASPPVLPPINWFITEDRANEGRFDLVNSSPDADAFDVIVSDALDAQVVGKTHWEKIPRGSKQRFGVYVGSDARMLGAEFPIKWRDANGVDHERFVKAKMRTLL